MSDKSLLLVIGLLAGVLLGCLGGIAMVAFGVSGGHSAEPATPPDGALVEAAISEDYLNRTFLDSLGTSGGAALVYDGRVDVQPGNRLRFIAQLDTPIGLATTRGTVELAVVDGLLSIRILEVRLGQLPVTLLARPFLAGIEKQINEQANRLLTERSSSAPVKLLGMTSNESEIRFYLVDR